MTQVEFVHLRDSVKELTLEQLRSLREALDDQLMLAGRTGREDLSDSERADQELQLRLFEAGLLSEIKPPRRLIGPAEEFEPIRIEGEPLSEQIIRERR